MEWINTQRRVAQSVNMILDEESATAILRQHLSENAIIMLGGVTVKRGDTEVSLVERGTYEELVKAVQDRWSVGNKPDRKIDFMLGHTHRRWPETPAESATEEAGRAWVEGLAVAGARLNCTVSELMQAIKAHASPGFAAFLLLKGVKSPEEVQNNIRDALSIVRSQEAEAKAARRGSTQALATIGRPTVHRVESSTQQTRDDEDDSEGSDVDESHNSPERAVFATQAQFAPPQQQWQAPQQQQYQQAAHPEPSVEEMI